MKNLIKVLLIIAVWCSIGLGTGYSVSKFINKSLSLADCIAFSLMGPLALFTSIIVLSLNSMDKCILNCEIP